MASDGPRTAFYYQVAHLLYYYCMETVGDCSCWKTSDGVDKATPIGDTAFADTSATYLPAGAALSHFGGGGVNNDPSGRAASVLISLRIVT